MRGVSSSSTGGAWLSLPDPVDRFLDRLSGSTRRGVIHDVLVKSLAMHADQRGYFTEQVKRGDLADDGRPFAPIGPFAQMSRTLSFARGGNPPELIKAFHWHARQWDYWDVVSGDARVVLIDVRPDSPTAGTCQVLMAGSHAPKVIAIPPLVLHGYQVLSMRDVVLCYYVTEPYDPAHPDEGRVAYDDARVGFDWTVENI
jgi:dTDP-4-dehydrorhamnose 3,5-epimerase